MIRNIVIIIAFGVICLFSALIMALKTGQPLEQTMTPPSVVFGPIETQKANEVVNISFRKSVPLGTWTSIDVDVEDEKGEYLFGFGDELWHESGWDAEGQWVESKTSYDMDITFKEPGKYFFNIEVQGSTPTQTKRTLTVVAKKKIGSSLPFLLAGIVAILIAAFLFWVRENMSNFK